MGHGDYTFRITKTISLKLNVFFLNLFVKLKISYKANIQFKAHVTTF